jgi:segregation and condensation protein B
VNDIGAQWPASRDGEPAAETAQPAETALDAPAAVHAATTLHADTGSSAHTAQPVLPGASEDTNASEDADAEADAAPGIADASRPDLARPETLRAAVESVLFIADAPISVTALAAGLQRPAPAIEAALAALGRELDERGSGIELREVGDGVRLYTRPHLAGWIETFLVDGQRVRLTQAALETLAVIAYRQPVTRARISAIRGVNVDSVVRTLTTRGLITEVGADPETGGGLYRTTELFLERMGLRTLEELPSLAPLLPELTGLDSDELSG